MEESTIALFCCLDDFARMFLDWEHHKLIGSERQRIRAGILSLRDAAHHGVVPYLFLEDLQRLLVRWAAERVSPLLQ